MKLPAYPDTAPSGLPGIGKLPKHWEVIRGRFVMQVNPPAPRLRELTPEDQVSFVPMEAVGENGGLKLDQTRALADVSSGYTEFQDGDVVVAKITPCFENGKAALASGLVNSAAYGTTELHVLRAGPALDRRFLFYVAISDRFRKLGESEMYGAGGQKRVPPEFNKDFPMTVPPPPEQKQIAAFLDWKTGQIDALIVRKHELLDRLKEKRRAVITQAVSRGLDPDAPLRDSGIPWLGKVPEHWKVRRLRFLVDGIDQGWSPRASNAAAEGDEIGVLKLSAVSRGRFVPEENKMLEEVPENQAIQTPQKHDLLITRANTPELVGDACAVQHDYPHLIIPDLIYRLKVNLLESDEGFISYFLLSKQGRAQIEAEARGSSGSMVKLGQGHLKNFQIPLAPVQEQHTITANLDMQTDRIEGLMDKIGHAIDRLTEYRTALITAATTGKIDVRNVRIPEPVALP